MAYTIKTLIANRNNYGNYRNKKDIKFAVVHYTANDGDSDENNAKYFAREIVKASAHYFIDDDSITKSVPDEYIAYHCGANIYYNACRNKNSIGFELCDTVKNGISDFTNSELSLACDLISDKMIEYNIPYANLVRHYDVTHKICPKPFVDDYNKWIEFKRKVAYKIFVKKFQKIRHITIDGLVGNETLGATITISKYKNTRNEIVAIIQEYLNILGYDCGTVDGIAGNKFDMAIKKYQKEVVGLSNCDGELTAGKLTWKTLLKYNK